MKKKLLSSFILIISLMSCIRAQDDTPLITVIKLQSAERILNFEAAKRYIDINRVYSKHPESTSPEKEWRTMLEFFYNIGQDNKFTNAFDYHAYRIQEEIKKNKAVVSFISENPKSGIKKIKYTLELQENRWVVVDIKYVK